MTYYDQVAEAAAFLKARLGSLTPRVGIVLGSGLGAVADAVDDPVIVPYAEIPHFPQSTVEGHSGRIVAGLLGARRWSSCRGACTITRATRRSRSPSPCGCWARWEFAPWC